MTQALETPFDTIESAHEFVNLLSDAIAEAKQEIETHLQQASREKTQRRRHALLIASYNLEKLEAHMKSSGRILNDLRTLRRLLYAEREVVSEVLVRNGIQEVSPVKGDKIGASIRPPKRPLAVSTGPSNGSARTATAA